MLSGAEPTALDRLGGWSNARSDDLVTWHDEGIHLAATKETYQGMASDSSPCSGFMYVEFKLPLCYVEFKLPLCIATIATHASFHFPVVAIPLWSVPGLLPARPHQDGGGRRRAVCGVPAVQFNAGHNRPEPGGLGLGRSVGAALRDRDRRPRQSGTVGRSQVCSSVLL